MLSHYTLRNAIPADAPRCYEIETSAYEGDEAATLEKIALRIERYPQGFLILEVDGKILGFINSGCADQVEMSDENFKELIGHDPQGAHNVIMSVVVDPDYQGQGLAALLMHNYLWRMRKLKKRSVQLMCRQQHIAMYAKMGFSYIKPSASDHGGLAWHEMVQVL